MSALSVVLRHIKPYWKTAVLAPVFMGIEVLLDLVQPWLMHRTIDLGIRNSDIRFIYNTTVLMLAVAVFGMIFGAGSVFYATKAALGFSTDLRQQLFDKIVHSSSKALEPYEPGQLITRLTDDLNQVQALVISGLRLMIRAPLTMAGAMVMAIVTAPALVPIMLIIIPLLSIGLYLIIKRAFPQFREVQNRLDELNTTIQESVSGLRVIRSFNREDFITNRFFAHNENITAFSINAARTVSLIFPMMFFVVNIGVLSALWFGGMETMRGNMQVGEIVAFINYLLLLLYSLMMMGMVLMNVSRAEASAARIAELLTLPPENASQDTRYPATLKGTLDFKHVSYCFGKTSCEPALIDLNFSIKPGETVALMGTIGSGKTTLMRLIPKLLQPSEGKILFDGICSDSLDTEGLRSQIGFAHQVPLLFSGSVAENLRFGRPEATDQEIWEALDIAQASDFIRATPEGLAHNISQKGKNLSGGQKQRLSIARAVIRKPRFLLLDDCTSALDSSTERQLLSALKNKLNTHTSTLMIVQRISTAKQADRILLLDNGRLVGDGTHQDLLSNCSQYRDIFDSQTGNSNGEIRELQAPPRPDAVLHRRES